MVKTVVNEKKSPKPNIFKRFFQKIREFFKELKPLVMMQLKDKLDISFKNKKRALFKVIYTLLSFAIITFVIYFLFNLIVNLSLFSFLKTLNFRFYLIIITFVSLLSLLSCVISITKTLYFAKDNTVLLTMPVTTNKLFVSKIIVQFLYELIKNSFYILPLLIAYGLIMKLGFLYFPYAIIMTIFLTAFIVVLAGVLSIPAMGIAILFKKSRIVEIVVLVVLSVGIVLALIGIINLIPENIDLVRDWGKIYWQIQDFLASFAKTFFMFDLLTQLLTGMVYNGFTFNPVTGNNGVTFLVMFGSMVVLLVIISLLSKPLFLKMASSPFEYKKVLVNKSKKNKKKQAFISVVDEEAKRSFRTPDIIYPILLTAIITPLAIFLQNKIVGAMDTRILGNYMAVAFNVCIILLIALNSNVTMSSVFSKEGNSAYLNKVNPVAFSVMLGGKLVLNACIMMISIIASSVVLGIGNHLSTLNIVLLAFTLLFIYVGHLFWSAEYDIMNPQNNFYQTTGTHHKNPNETKSTILSFAISAIVAFVTFFLIKEDIRYVFYKLLAIALLFVIYRTFIFFTKIKLYYKEK